MGLVQVDMKSTFALLIASVLCESFSDAQANSRGCQLPVPSDGPARRYCPLQCPQCQDAGGCYLTPGSLVSAPITRVQCAPGYRLQDDHDYSLVVCTNGNWEGKFPDCLAQCPPLESDSAFPRCQLNGRVVDCSRPVMPRTTASVECKPHHSQYPGLASAGIYSKPLTCRYDGKWSRNLPQCKPDCGLSKGSSKVQATVALDSVDTPLGVFPWHAGIYQREGQDWKYICGGSLITKRIVLTAAHCVSVDPQNLQVTFAKYYRDWGRDEPLTVKLNVSAVSVPREFSYSTTNLNWDIGLLLLSAPVEVNSYVMPVCQGLRVDPNRNFTGYVVGWGRNESGGEFSDYLLHNDLPITYRDNCARKLPKVVAVDKFCASKQSLSVVERGDSGGGLTVIWNHQHYIIGIISIKYQDISVFTNISWPTHQSWMDNEINRIEDDLSKCPSGGFQCGGSCFPQSARCDGYSHCPDGSDESGCDSRDLAVVSNSASSASGGCLLPDQPPHGRYTPSLGGPGTPVSAQFRINYACDPGHKFSVDSASTTSAICAENGKWTAFPQCVDGDNSGCRLPRGDARRRFCSPDCDLCSEREGSGCHWPGGAVVAPGKAVRVTCAPGFSPNNNWHFSINVCVNSSWTEEIPPCLRMCEPLKSRSVSARCFNGDIPQEVNCGELTVPGTWANFTCLPSYTEYPSLREAGAYDRHPVCLEHGYWSNDLPECKPTCGSTQTSDAPWHALIYQNKSSGWELRCSGTLINRHTILAGTHCVGLLYNGPLKVALGKLRLAWDEDEHYTIKRDVSVRRWPVNYNKIVSGVWDLVLVMVEPDVEFTSYVMPVCLATDDTTVAGQLKDPAEKVYVTGWDLKGEEVTQDEVSLKPRDECTREVQNRRWFGIDQFCGSRQNAETSLGYFGGGVTVVDGRSGLHHLLGQFNFRCNGLLYFTDSRWPPHRPFFASVFDYFRQLADRGFTAT